MSEISKMDVRLNKTAPERPSTATTHGINVPSRVQRALGASLVGALPCQYLAHAQSQTKLVHSPLGPAFAHISSHSPHIAPHCGPITNTMSAYLENYLEST